MAMLVQTIVLILSFVAKLWGYGDFAGAVIARITKAIPCNTLASLATDENAASGLQYQPICNGSSTYTSQSFYGDATTGVFRYVLIGC